jgi:hypothetical protein
MPIRMSGGAPFARPARDCVSVRGHDIARRLCPGKLPRANHTSLRRRRRVRIVVNHPFDGTGELVDVLWIDEQSGVPEHLWKRAPVGRNDWNA